MGITEAQLEEKLGVPVAKWTERDVAQLGVIYKSMPARRDPQGRGIPARALPGPRVTVNEIMGGRQRRTLLPRNRKLPPGLRVRRSLILTTRGLRPSRDRLTR